MTTEISISEVVPNPNQPRKHFDEVSLRELADSIIAEGLQLPILVRPHPGGYEVVQGERRYRAHILAGMVTIKAEIRELSDSEAFHLAVIENIQREQLTDIEEARAYGKYAEQGMTHEQIADKVKKSRTYVSSKMRLLKLSERTQASLERGEITESHAKQILKMESFVNRMWGRSISGTPFEDFQEKFHGSFWKELERKELTVSAVKAWSDTWRFSNIKSLALHVTGNGWEVVSTERFGDMTAEMECAMFGLHPSNLLEEDINFACAFDKEYSRPSYSSTFRPWMVEQFWDGVRGKLLEGSLVIGWNEPRSLPAIQRERERGAESLEGKTLDQLLAEILDNRSTLYTAVGEIAKRTGQAYEEVLDEILAGMSASTQ